MLAQQDLLNIRQYIETELANPAAARRTIERMLKAIRQLEQFPLSGAPLQYNGADTGYRYVTSGNYVAFYIGTHATVQVVRVLYGRRDTIRILLGARSSQRNQKKIQNKPPGQPETAALFLLEAEVMSYRDQNPQRNPQLP